MAYVYLTTWFLEDYTTIKEKDKKGKTKKRVAKKN